MVFGLLLCADMLLNLVVLIDAFEVAALFIVGVSRRDLVDVFVSIFQLADDI